MLKTNFAGELTWGKINTTNLGKATIINSSFNNCKKINSKIDQRQHKISKYYHEKFSNKPSQNSKNLLKTQTSPLKIYKKRLGKNSQNSLPHP